MGAGSAILPIARYSISRHNDVVFFYKDTGYILIIKPQHCTNEGSGGNEGIEGDCYVAEDK